MLLVVGVVVVVLVNVYVALISFYNFYYKRRTLPPGPPPLPIVGNLLSIRAEPAFEDCFIRWAKEYGPIFTFWLGEVPIVMMTDVAQIVATFHKDGDTYAGRYSFREMETLLKGGTFGVIGTEGELWREHRRFALHVFRDFGVGKNLMQEKILEEIGARFKVLNEQLEANPAYDVNIAAILDISVGSIINSILFGNRFDGEHEHEFFTLKQIVKDMTRLFSRPEFYIMNLRPALFTRLPYLRTIFAQLQDSYGALRAFYMKQISAHEAQIDAANVLDESSTDYVEAFLKQREEKKGFGEKNHNYSMDQLVHMCFDLWLAGQETTSTTLAWGIAYILWHPEVQHKIHDELDSVVGSVDHFVTVAHKSQLPYIAAVVNEIQRLANLVPVNVLHTTAKDVTIGGYFLPKGTCITPQISAVLYNEEYFKNAKEFNPNRFLTADGEVKKCDQLIPFSVGKRQCLGEPLARMELFLFLANIFNQYKLTAGANPPSLKRELGSIVACPNFFCKMEKRCDNSLQRDQFECIISVLMYYFPLQRSLHSGGGPYFIRA